MAKQLSKPNLLASTDWPLSLLDLSDAMMRRTLVYYGIVHPDGRVHGRYVHIGHITPEDIFIDGERVDLDVNNFFKSPYQFFKHQIEIREHALDTKKDAKKMQLPGVPV